MYKSIGVWGYGVVGASVVRLCVSRGIACGVLETRVLTTDERAWLESHNVAIVGGTQVPPSYEQIVSFFSQWERVVPSPGIDLRPYAQCLPYVLTELDFFAQHWCKSTLAVTGSLGKTSVVHVLSHALRASGVEAIAAGNIGIGMCDVVAQPVHYSCVVLEVSSFQLEHVQSWLPDVYIVTNVYPNHLDRHGSMEAYQQAKLAVIARMAEKSVVIVPWQLRAAVYEQSTRVRTVCVSAQELSERELRLLRVGDACLYISGDSCIWYEGGVSLVLCSRVALPGITFVENELMVCAALRMYMGDISGYIGLNAPPVALPAYRLAYIGDMNGAPVYNDSKSTVGQATVCAVAQVRAQRGRAIVVILGGVSKGVDRASCIEQLAHTQYGVRLVVCFGAEAGYLADLCIKYGLAVYACATLQEVVTYCRQIVCSDDVLIFSPAGASFDLFANYQERGACFDRLVLE